MTDMAKLVVKLEAESAKLHRDLDKANKKLNTFSKSANKAGKALKSFAKVGAAGLAASALVLGAMAKRTLDLADRIGKLSTATGISTEALSRFAFAAELTGSNFESLVKGFTKLQRSMFDANEGLVTQQRAFEQLGVAVVGSDGKLKDTNVVIGDVADAFAKMEDGAKKGALAQIIFGRAGRDMIPFLNQGREGIKAMADEADALGITMSGTLTAAAEETNDNLTRIKTAMEGVFLRVMAQAMPKILEFTKLLVKWAKDSENVTKSMKFIGNAMKVVGTIATFLSGVFTLVGEGLGAMFASIALALDGEFSKAVNVWKEATASSMDTVVKTVENLGSVWKDVPEQIASKADETASKIASPIVAAEEHVGMSVDAVKAKLKTLDKAMADAAKKSDDVSKEFQDRFNNLTSTKTDAKDANIIDFGFMENQAQQMLAKGDLEGATEKVRQAFDILDAMKEAGAESSLVLEGLGASLKRVGDDIASSHVTEAKAKIDIDTTGMIEQIGEINAAMQAVLDGNPLTQTISINSSSVPNAATQRAAGNDQLQPMNITMPDGRQMQNVYADSAGATQFRREMSQEANKRGKR